jgi:hypothetical protein
MQDQDLRMMLIRVRNTIVDQRERLAVAEPKARSYDGMMRILDMTESRNYAAEPDIVSMLEKELELVRARMETVPEPAARRPEGEYIADKL